MIICSFYNYNNRRQQSRDLGYKENIKLDDDNGHTFPDYSGYDCTSHKILLPIKARITPVRPVMPQSDNVLLCS